MWPLDDVSIKDIEIDLNTLADRGLIYRYTVDDKNYLAVTSWAEHQRVHHPAQSRIPAQSDGITPSPEDLRSPPDKLPQEVEQGTGKGTGKGGNRPRRFPRAHARRATRIPEDFTVTTDMVDWARRNAPHVDGRYETAQFRDYWRPQVLPGGKT
ncbi:MAG: hypothetical protein ACRDRW_10925 [Pseudonocardiaceae bacterium]